MNECPEKNPGGSGEFSDTEGTEAASGAAPGGADLSMGEFERRGKQDVGKSRLTKSIFFCYIICYLISVEKICDVITEV